MVWDGEKLIDLDYTSADDYGICPKELKIDEFASTSYFTRMWLNDICLCYDLQLIFQAP